MFRWKDYIYEVYKEKSFSKAAQNLYISQPSLSAKIKKAEGEIGLPVFDRNTTPLRLTEFGESYIAAVEEIYKIEKAMENHINDLKNLQSGHIFVGASNLFAAYALPSIIADFKNKFPSIEIKLTEGNTATLEEMLSSNALDMVIDNNHYDSELYDKELYSKEIILLAVPKEYSLFEKTKEFAITKEDIKTRRYLGADYPRVTLSLFKDIPFVMLSLGNDTRIRGDKLCKEAGFSPKIALELNQQATAYMTASTGIGAAFVSDTLVAKLPMTDKFEYFKLNGEAAERSVYFYYKKRKVKTGAMQEFIKLIGETLGE